ncbi:MAG: hypothetical protein V3T30_04865 [Thermodesulfobacteriota bacterium]
MSESIYICSCACHMPMVFKGKHPGACCAECPKCGRRIVIGHYSNHEAKCGRIELATPEEIEEARGKV